MAGVSWSKYDAERSGIFEVQVGRRIIVFRWAAY
jgi:hypothetical protein